MNDIIDTYKKFNQLGINEKYSCVDIGNVKEDLQFDEKPQNIDDKHSFPSVVDNAFIYFILSKYMYISFDGIERIVYGGNKTIDGIDKILFHMEEDNKIFINNSIFLKITKKQHNMHDKFYFFYDLFNNIKIIPNIASKSTFVSFQIFGPDEIKDNTLHLLSDFFDATEIFRKNLFNYDVSNNNLMFYRPTSWNKNIKYDKLELTRSTDLNLDIKMIENKMNDINDFLNMKQAIKTNANLIEVRNLQEIFYEDCLFEYKSLILYMMCFFIILKRLIIGGSIIIEIPKINYDATIQLLYFVSQFFSQLSYFKSVLYMDCTRIVFSNFKGIDDENINLLATVIKKIIAKDISYGTNLNTKTQIKTYCLYNKFKEGQTELFVTNLFQFKNKMSNEFIEFIKKINKKWNEFNESYHSIYDRVKKFMYDNKTSLRDRQKFVNAILKINFDNSLKWCIDNNIAYDEKIMNILSTQKYQKNKFKMEYFFPKGADYKKLKMTNESYYSISHPNDSTKITELLAKYLDKPMNQYIITDGTSNVGGNSINFCKNFKFVNCVEIDTKTSEYLNNNIKQYGFDNYKIYNDDYTKIAKTLKQDIVFLDPPWGGILYKYYDKINLYLSDYSLIDVIELIISNCKIICVKVPFNFDIYTIYNKITQPMFIYKLSKFTIIIIDCQHQ